MRIYLFLFYFIYLFIYSFIYYSIFIKQLIFSWKTETTLFYPPVCVGKEGRRAATTLSLRIWFGTIRFGLVHSFLIFSDLFYSLISSLTLSISIYCLVCFFFLVKRFSLNWCVISTCFMPTPDLIDDIQINLISYFMVRIFFILTVVP